MSSAISQSDPTGHLITEPLLSSFTPIKLDNGNIRMAIAIAGQSAYNSKGEKKVLSEEFLSTDYQTWENGLVSTNHENTNPFLGGATIHDLEYDSENKLVIATFANLPEMARKLINSEFYQGLSQECIPTMFSENMDSVVRGRGTGVTIVMWPHKPAASPDMGVGVRPVLASILKSKYPSQEIEDLTMTEKTGDGKPVVSIEAFEKTVSENVKLESQIVALESEKKTMSEELASTRKEFEGYKSGEADRLKIAIESAISNYDANLKSKAEKEEAVMELHNVMGKDAADNYLSTNPTVEQIKSIAGIMKVNFSKGVGSSQSSPNEDGKSYEQLNSEWNAKLGRV